MKSIRVALALTGLLAGTFWLNAAVTLRYAARVTDQHGPFTGAGLFVFELVDAKGESFWRSGPLPAAGANAVPKSALRLQVTNGNYSVQLGSPELGMAPLPSVPAIPARMRVWFNDSDSGWQLASDEELRGTPLAPQTNQLAASLRSNAAPRVVTVRLDSSAPSLGRADAPVVLVEFTDFECVYCQRFARNTFPALLTNEVRRGTLRIISYLLPQRSHAHASAAARAAWCAQAQGRFWDLHERLFAEGSLDAGALETAGRSANLDMAQWLECRRDAQWEKREADESALAHSVGITGTPAFVLGRPGTNSITGTIIAGARPYSVFAAEIQRLSNDAR